MSHSVEGGGKIFCSDQKYFQRFRSEHKTLCQFGQIEEVLAHVGVQGDHDDQASCQRPSINWGTFISFPRGFFKMENKKMQAWPIVELQCFADLETSTETPRCLLLNDTTAINVIIINPELFVLP